MNALDNLLLLILVAVLLFYCYKKKKFPFSKLKKEDQNGSAGTADTTAGMPTGTNNIAPMPIQNTGAFSQMYPYLCGMPTAIPMQIMQCRIISVDSNAIDSDADLEYIVNTELSKLTATGCKAQSVDTFEYSTADGTDTTCIAFCITYTK